MADELLAPIKIEGLRDLQAQLKAMDGESQRQLRVVLNEAAKLVVTGAKARAPERTGAFKSSIRALSTQREARVAEGSSRVPYAGWLDFGGKTGKRGHNRREFIKGGRYVYPAYYANRDEILEALNKGIVQMAENSGFVATEE